MATIAENLQILVDNKANIKEAIERLRDEDITKRMSAWADLINDYEDKLQDATSNTAFPFRFPITFKPEQTISKYFPFSLPLTFTPPPAVNMKINIATAPTNLAIVHAHWYTFHINTVVKSIIVDGTTSVPIPTRGEHCWYNFTTAGEHTIEMELYNNTEIPARMFDGLKYTADIEIKNVSKIYTNSFTGMTNATIKLPDTVTNIPSVAGNGIHHLILGNNVKSFGNQAFRNTPYITIYSVTPPVPYEWNHFGSNIAIYVPAESVQAYKTATGWVSVASIIQAIPE